MHISRSISLPVAVVTVLSLAGCQLDQFASGITKYDTANQTFTSSLTGFFLSANDTYRLLYFQDLKLHPDAYVQIGDPAQPDGSLPKDTKHKLEEGAKVAARAGLDDLYSDEAIQAHVHALNVIARYSKALVAISSTGSVADAKKQLDAFKTNATAVANEFKTLGGKNGAKVAAIAGPISGIGAIVGKWAIDAMQLKDIKKSIRSCHGDVQDLIVGLKRSTSSISISIRDHTKRVELDYEQVVNDHFTAIVSAKSSAGDKVGVEVLAYAPKEGITGLAQVAPKPKADKPADDNTDPLAKAIEDSGRKDLMADFQKIRFSAERTAALSADDAYDNMASAENDLNGLAEQGKFSKNQKSSWEQLDADLSSYAESVDVFKKAADIVAAQFKTQ